ncbi:nucleoside-diphosphate sugar epimerase/dehydratase [soil metagenome]
MRRTATRQRRAARRRLVSLFGRRRLITQITADAVAWLLAVPAAAVMRHDFVVERLQLPTLMLFLVVVLVLQGLVGAREGLYVGRYRYGSFEEVAALARTVVVVTAVGAVVNRFAFPERLPLSVPFLAAAVALVLTAAFRYAWRLTLESHQRPSLETAEPVVVFGAGEGAEQLITSMVRNPESPYLPVAVLDDDPATRQLRIRGVAVAGDRWAMKAVADRKEAATLVIAIPSASAKEVRDLAALAADAELEVLVLPPVGELLGQPSVEDVRPLSIADLLGRHEIDTDLASIAGYLTGKRVLVTGAGGSIGSELCRQLYQFAPAALVLVDRDESALHAVQLAIHGRALLDGGDLVVADIREAERVKEIFEAHRPEVVFHAAALKHLPLLEQHPAEAVKTNVFGTVNVLEAAMAFGVERFVNISTDKAADPISVLGYTKRIAERLTAWAATEGDGVFLSVRFGNVLGSRGSVLSSFRAQIDAGGPVTVTHPDVTRFFMTVEEAVQLVVQAGAVGRDGEALVLDMGEPVGIADVAERLIDESGKRIEIVFTGLRPGEKLHEVLFSAHEEGARPAHPLISHVEVPALRPEMANGQLRGVPGTSVAHAVRCLSSLPHDVDALG